MLKVMYSENRFEVAVSATSLPSVTQVAQTVGKGGEEGKIR